MVVGELQAVVDSYKIENTTASYDKRHTSESIRELYEQYEADVAEVQQARAKVAMLHSEASDSIGIHERQRQQNVNHSNVKHWNAMPECLNKCCQSHGVMAWLACLLGMDSWQHVLTTTITEVKLQLGTAQVSSNIVMALYSYGHIWLWPYIVGTLYSYSPI